VAKWHMGTCGLSHKIVVWFWSDAMFDRQMVSLVDGAMSSSWLPENEELIVDTAQKCELVVDIVC
jgi:hypothetical protein